LPVVVDHYQASNTCWRCCRTVQSQLG